MQNIHFISFMNQYRHLVDTELRRVLQTRFDLNVPGKMQWFPENGLIHEALLQAKVDDVRPFLSNSPTAYQEFDDAMAVVLAVFPEQRPRIEKANKSDLWYSVSWDHDYDMDLVIRLQKVPGIGGEQEVIDFLEAGHTEYEIRTFGPYVIKVYTAKELAQVTVDKAPFKSFCSFFKHSFSASNAVHSPQDVPSIVQIEDIVNAGFANTAEYKEYANLFNVVPTRADNIDFLVERRRLLNNDQVKRLIEIQDGLPTLNDCKQLSSVLVKGKTVEDYEKVYNLANLAAEERFADYNATSSVIARILNNNYTLDTVENEVKQGKALGEIC